MKSGLPRSALVLDADQPHALCIVQSLARKGIAVDTAASGTGPIAGFSRHSHKTHRYPDPLTDGAGFVDALETITRAGGFDLVIPVTERTLPVIARERARFADHTRLAIASDAALDLVLDKHKTLRIASALGIPIPQSQWIDDTDTLARVAADSVYPVVLKPASSIPFGNNEAPRAQISVRYAFSQSELIAAGADVLRYCPLIVQEYVGGDGVGIEILAGNGEILYAFQHRRLHEVPLTGGGSSLRISDQIHPKLLEYSARLVSEISWDGCAMVEFKLDRERSQGVLMEINGRFWGSLPLAVAAGADFPGMLFDYLVDGHASNLLPARVGVLARKLSSDIDWHEQVLRRSADPRLVRYPGNDQILRDLLKVFSIRHNFDVQSWSDPLPGLIDIGRIVSEQGRRIGELVATKLRHLRASSFMERLRFGRRVRKAEKVLFLCFGNINRSAVAQRHAERVGVAFQPRSAGFFDRAGRRCDPNMVRVANRHGLEMRDWSSISLSAEMVADADLILVMEVHQLTRLYSEYPASRGKAFLLALAGSEDGNAEIADPYGQAADAYLACFHSVTSAVDGLAKLTEKNR